MINLQFLGLPHYSVTKEGKVWSDYSNRFLKGSISLEHHDKYEKVMLVRPDKTKRFITVHRLVAFAYLEKPFGRDYVNHKDGNIFNNNVENLEWVTALENNLHSIKYVRKPQLLSNTNLKLPEMGNYKDRGKGRCLITEEEAIQYCEYMKQGYRGCDLRMMMGIAISLFTSFIEHREHKFKYIADRYDFSHLPRPKKLTQEQVHEICNMLQDGHKVMHIYKTLDVSRTVVRKIKGREHHKAISDGYVW